MFADTAIVSKYLFAQTKQDIQTSIDIKSILDGLPDPSLFVDIQGNVLLYNYTFFEFINMRPRQYYSNIEQNGDLIVTLQSIFNIDTEIIKSVFENKKVNHFADITFKNNDGVLFKGMRSYIPVLVKENECCGVIIHFRDLSPEAQMQERYETLILQKNMYAEDLEKKVSEKTQELTKALKEVTLLSRTDSLTGLLNRQVFSDIAQKTIEIAKRYDEGLALMMFDLDNFKHLNDNYGHQAGDRVLQATTQKLKEMIRDTDFIGRYGGEEFIVLLRTSSTAKLLRIGERCLDVIRNLPIRSLVPGKENIQTISIGCALFPEHADNLNDLIKCADDALYEAKANGRDRLVLYSTK